MKKKAWVTFLLISVLMIGCGNTKSSENKTDIADSVTESDVIAEKNDVESKEEDVKKTATETGGDSITSDETEKQVAEDESTSSDVFESYSNALITAKNNPAEVWNGVSVKEIRSAIGIHFYIPVDWSLTSEMSDEGIEESYNCDQEYGYVLSTSVYNYPGNDAPFDWGENQSPFEIGKIGNDHYFITTVYNCGFEEDKYNPDLYFPEINKYREMITETAWVEKDPLTYEKIGKQGFENMVFGDETREKLAAHYQEVLNPEGSFVCYSIDDEINENVIRTAIRYQLSENEVEAITANGGEVMPNIYCFTIELDTNTGDVKIVDVDQWHNWAGIDNDYSKYDWNIND